MSFLEDKMGDLLKELFPFLKIKREYPIKYKGHNLFFDYYIPSLSLIVEVHGDQHDKFVEFFHTDSSGWKAHIKRDKDKLEWAELNGITVLVFREKDFPETSEELMTKIKEVKNA